MKESEKAVMAEFMDYVKLIIATLSYNVFAPVTEAKDNRQYFFCKSEKLKAEAKGFVSPGGFTVLKGSVISVSIAPSVIKANTKDYVLRVKLEESGIIRDRKFQNDYEFSSPSAASSVVLGFNASGNYYWRTEDGLRLGDILKGT